jgi:hypothetical protein
VKPTRRNRGARRCTRYVRMRGSYSRAGSAGLNRFRFSGRLRGRKLKPGRYRLVGNAAGDRAAARFTIVRR